MNGDNQFNRLHNTVHYTINIVLYYTIDYLLIKQCSLCFKCILFVLKDIINRRKNQLSEISNYNHITAKQLLNAIKNDKNETRCENNTENYIFNKVTHTYYYAYIHNREHLHMFFF